jgi:hypothetical protein
MNIMRSSTHRPGFRPVVVDEEDDVAAGVMRKRHRTGVPPPVQPRPAAAAAPVATTPLWRVGEEARELFDRLAEGDELLRGEPLRIFASSLGWPERGMPEYLLCAFAVYQHAPVGQRSVVCLHRDAWVRAFQSLGTADPAAATERLWADLRADYCRRGQPCPRFLAFYRFVFVYLLIEHSAHTAPRGAAPQFPCVDPSGQLFGTFCRSVPSLGVKRGLIATLGRLSPFVMSFCGFMDAAGVRTLNLDQWANFVAFSRAHRPETLLQRYSSNDCWSTLIDSYVEWLRTSYAAPHAMARRPEPSPRARVQPAPLTADLRRGVRGSPDSDDET